MVFQTGCGVGLAAGGRVEAVGEPVVALGASVARQLLPENGPPLPELELEGLEGLERRGGGPMGTGAFRLLGDGIGGWCRCGDIWCVIIPGSTPSSPLPPLPPPEPSGESEPPSAFGSTGFSPEFSLGRCNTLMGFAAANSTFGGPEAAFQLVSASDWELASHAIRAASGAPPPPGPYQVRYAGPNCSAGLPPACCPAKRRT